MTDKQEQALRDYLQEAIIPLIEQVLVKKLGQAMSFAAEQKLVAPQRTWVGLTDDDKVLIKHDANYNQFMTAGEYADRVQQLTEARLKDKNT